MNNLTNNEMWTAVINNDATYDGLFLYGVKTVGVYCHPSCKSRTPLQKNIRFFHSQQDAEQAGYRPCKRCFSAPVLDLVNQVEELIDQHQNDAQLLAQEIKKLGLTTNQLTIFFKQQYNVTPRQYISKMRLKKIKQLLAETNEPIIQIAILTGYESLPSFYSFFKKYMGMTPAAYRDKNKV